MPEVCLGGDGAVSLELCPQPDDQWGGLLMSACFQDCPADFCTEGMSFETDGGPRVCLLNSGAPVEGVFRSRDGGRTWESFHQGVQAVPVRGSLGEYVRVQGTPMSLVADPLEPGRVYLGFERGLFTALDDGESWSQLLQDNVQGLWVHPTTGRVWVLLLAASGWVLQVSDDQGQTWTPRSLEVGELVEFDPRDIAFHPDEPDLVLVAGMTSPSGSANYLRSQDGGLTWQVRGTPWAEEHRPVTLMLATSPDEPDLVYMSTVPGPIFSSRNFGLSWEYAPAGPPQCRAFLAVEPGPGGRLLCGQSFDGRSGSNLWALDPATDTWSEIEAGHTYWFNGLAWVPGCSAAFGYQIEGGLWSLGGYERSPTGALVPSGDFGSPDCGATSRMFELGSLIRRSEDGTNWKPAVGGLPVLRYSSAACVSLRLRRLLVSPRDPNILLAAFSLQHDCMY